ncbi:MAG: SCO family protein [Bdellovibrionales bacterium]|nr:SCO family protein [Bdellovibrionales bacterium]
MLLSSVASAQVYDEQPERLEKIDVIEKFGQTIPTDFTFIDENGDSVSLSNYFHDEKPVILTFVYYRCPMLCTFVLNALAESLNQLQNWVPGEDYHLVTISINTEETPEVAKTKQANYLKLFENPAFKNHNVTWHFWTSPDNQVSTLANNIGFQYYYDEEIKEFAHPAVVFLLTDEGVLSRNIYGLNYPTKDMRFALLEASEGKIGTAIEKILLYCYHYDPEQGSYVLFAQNTMKVAGLFTIFILSGFLGMMWKFEKSRTEDKGDQSA